MKEIFKTIKGFEGRYEVSNFGRVKSKGKIIKGWINDNGYKRISLSMNSTQNKCKYVHQIVADAFLNYGSVTNIVCDHIDNDKTNNNLTNLQMITQRENTTKDQKNKSSKYRGVSLNAKSGKYHAKIYHNGNHINLGVFDDEKDAGDIYKQAIISIENGTDIKRKVRKESSKQKGVWYNNKRKKWIVRFSIKGKIKTLGTFETEDEAIIIAKKHISNA